MGRVNVMLCVLLVTCTAIQAADKVNKLSLFWPPGLCSDKQVSCQKETKEEFTIHGLWVEDKSHCSRKSPFDIQLLTPMIKDLEKSWPSFTCPNEHFWKDEWCKHGGSPHFASNPKAYFDRALELKNKFDLNDIFHCQGEKCITPSDVKHYKASEIANAIKSKTGKIPEISCIGQGKGKSKPKVLREVKICLSEDAKKVVDCTIHFHCACTDGSNKVLIPKTPLKLFVYGNNALECKELECKE